MVFSSTVFLFIFLPAVLGVYFVLPRAQRNAWLMLASLFFYAWGEKAFTLVMVSSIAVNYILGLLVGHFRLRAAGGWVLALGVSANLGLLIAYKYANFIVGSINPVWQRFHLNPIRLEPVHLPIGISFFTFHAISYIVDVHRGHARAQRSLFNFALYESLFPQLVAGPIIRYQDIADQIEDRRESLTDFAYGVRRFVIGLSRKILVANVLAIWVDQIFAMKPGSISAPVAWFGAVCYALQIYFDFAGYSDMAIGLGRMFGFRFVENFNDPYSATSIKEFWRRWHISLSTWFRDYLYIPLGGNRMSRGRGYFNLMAVFCLCGLWHGPSWNFLIWGLVHGFFLILEKQKWMSEMMNRSWRPLRHVYTLLIILAGWVFFRSESLGGALTYFCAMAGCGGEKSISSLDIDNLTLLSLAVGVVGSTPIAAFLARILMAPRTSAIAEGVGIFARTAALVVLFLLCAVQLAAGTYNPFIYFRF